MSELTTDLANIPGELRQFPAIWSEEGKYLASVLGDALVKGLTQVSHERPEDPVEYLANFLKKYRGADGNELPDKPDLMDADEHLKTVIQGLPISMADPMIKALEDGIKVEDTRSLEMLNEQANNLLQSQEVVLEEMPGPDSDPVSPPTLGLSSAQRVSTPHVTSASKIHLENHAETDEVAQKALLELKDSADLQVVPNEQELLNEIDADSTEMLQRLEDSADNDPNVIADEEDVDDENGIHNVDEMDDPNQGEGESTDHSQNGTRDDRGQSVLHFAAARPGGASTILAFLQNPSVNLSWRDERLRTARDIAKGMSRPDNTRTIDSWIISLAVAGDKESLEQLLIDGYDHLTDVEDSNGTHVIELAEKAGKRDVALFLRSIPDFNDRLLKVHKSVRNGDMEGCKNFMMRDHRLAVALSPWGRTALHVAVLVEEYDIVRFICEHFPDSLKRGDNIERTPLHYAMGVEKVEKMTRILVRNGAKRVVKDLRGRQPSYYFINREEISILQRQEQDLKGSSE